MVCVVVGFEGDRHIHIILHMCRGIVDRRCLSTDDFCVSILFNQDVSYCWGFGDNARLTIASWRHWSTFLRKRVYISCLPLLFPSVSFLHARFCLPTIHAIGGRMPPSTARADATTAQYYSFLLRSCLQLRDAVPLTHASRHGAACCQQSVASDSKTNARARRTQGMRKQRYLCCAAVPSAFCCCMIWGNRSEI